MAEEKPLHVRVAEALGCKLFLQRQTPDSLPSYWRCGCHPQAHGNILGIWPYDTDWSATGPLIEKYKMTVENVCGTLASYGNSAEWRAYVANAFGPKPVYGTTPLIAVCHLILALKEAGKLEKP